MTAANADRCSSCGGPSGACCTLDACTLEAIAQAVAERLGVASASAGSETSRQASPDVRSVTLETVRERGPLPAREVLTIVRRRSSLVRAELKRLEADALIRCTGGLWEACPGHSDTTGALSATHRSPSADEAASGAETASGRIVGNGRVQGSRSPTRPWVPSSHEGVPGVAQSRTPRGVVGGDR